MNEAQTQRLSDKDAILEAAMMHSAFDGWSKDTLLAAADEAGIDHVTAQRLFPRVGTSLIAWLDNWLDRRMDQAIEGIDLAKFPVRKRIGFLVMARIDAMGPHQEAMRRAALMKGLPHNLVRSGSGLWRTADKIWEMAGFANNSGDGFSRYTRRALLVGILTSTFLFWLEDLSENFQETREFLDRRIEDALKVGKVAQSVKKLSPFQSWRKVTA